MGQLNHDFMIRIIYLPVNPLVVDANALHQPRHGIFFVLAVAALRPQRQPRLGVPRDRIVGAVVVKEPEVTEGKKPLEGRRTFADLHGQPAVSFSASVSSAAKGKTIGCDAYCNETFWPTCESYEITIRIGQLLFPTRTFLFVTFQES